MWSKHRLSRAATSFLLVAGAFALTAGCSRPVGTVSGKVTYNSKPLKGGSVSFVSSEGRLSFSAGIDEDGSYTVPNIQGGTYKVCVETDSLRPSQTGYPTGTAPPGFKTPGDKGIVNKGPPQDAPVPEGYKASDPAAMAATTAAKRYVQIPPEYAGPDTTTLEYKFEGGTQTYNIDLK